MQHTPTAQGAPATAPQISIPVIDVSGVRADDRDALAAVATAVDQANQDIGFFTVTGHGVPPELVKRMYEVTAQFFHLPSSVKALSQVGPGGAARGWNPGTNRALARPIGQDRPPDLRETFSMGRPISPADVDWISDRAATFFHSPKWPTAVPDMRPVWTAYYHALEGVCTVLLRVFETALELPEHWFDATCDHHCSPLLANYYPPAAGPLRPDQLRAGPHTDWGSFTVLYQDDSPGGLQVPVRDRWCEVAPMPGTFVVNIGDLMARWTNDRWRSTLHRVVVPPSDAPGQPWRISIPFFHQPDYDALIECIPTCVGDGPRYAPITSGRNWEEKFAATKIR